MEFKGYSMSDSENTEKKVEEKKTGFFSRLKSGLKKTRNSLAGGLDNVVHGQAKVEPQHLDELEEALIMADVGIATTNAILKALKHEVALGHIRNKEDVLKNLKRLMVDILSENRENVDRMSEKPHIVLVIGVNGSGKTTTIGKLTQKWKNEGKSVLLGAGDTFRAAAIEQMLIWAERVGVPCIHQKSGADPSAVAFDAVQAAITREMDIALIDTAGRLQTNTNLMEELKKVKRVIGKVLPGAPHETLLVLDATIGQNSVSQAKLFHEAMEIDGLVMTKLDGTSKGGVLLNITRELKLPVRYIGIGEKADDLQEFDPADFVEALFSS
ncbi:Signal recognition particle receptor FtsY [hydrothermal vent metagenome]|uniref:Signal recognition particle receptor FtsY n=1 Tax=hydrothermal vent metagenome TaxID=652676 RepID=A0A3B1DA41_9ZZZZ